MNYMNRRGFLASSAALTGAIPASALPIFAQPSNIPIRASAAELITPKTQKAIDRGLAFLARRQILRGRGKGSFGTSGYSSGVAVSGLSGIAFMSSGCPPGQGPFGKNIDYCVDFIINSTQSSGFISGGSNRDNMYGHGFATLFLAEVYGMTMRKEAGEKLRQAIQLIVTTQNSLGGWRYKPIKADADLSITICQIMAMRAARDAGINVPNNTRQKCIEYVIKSQNEDGGFRYQINSGRSTFPLTAAGLVSLYSAGINDGPQINKGLKHLMTFMPGRGKRIGNYYYYGHYYAVQAAWHAGGNYWNQWYPAIRNEILSKQSPNGSWIDTGIGAEFATAMACIILQMPNNYLPIFSA